LQEDIALGLHYSRGEAWYSLHADDTAEKSFEGTFYSDFPDFQIVGDYGKLTPYAPEKTVVGHVGLENGWFFPFRTDELDFITNIFRGFDHLDPSTDRFSYYIRLRPIHPGEMQFYFRAKWDFFLLRIRLFFSFFRYLFHFKAKTDWKKEGRKFFEEKIQHELFSVEIFLVAESRTRDIAESRIKSIFQNFSVFKNYPLNSFSLSLEYPSAPTLIPSQSRKTLFLSGNELSLVFQFP
jgi:hypothetical protein